LRQSAGRSERSAELFLMTFHFSSVREMSDLHRLAGADCSMDGTGTFIRTLCPQAPGVRSGAPMNGRNALLGAHDGTAWSKRGASSGWPDGGGPWKPERANERTRQSLVCLKRLHCQRIPAFTERRQRVGARESHLPAIARRRYRDRQAGEAGSHDIRIVRNASDCLRSDPTGHKFEMARHGCSRAR